METSEQLKRLPVEALVTAAEKESVIFQTSSTILAAFCVYKFNYASSKDAAGEDIRVYVPGQIIVLFKSGQAYTYLIPENQQEQSDLANPQELLMYKKLVSADSQGKFVHENLKSLPARKLEQPELEILLVSLASRVMCDSFDNTGLVLSRLLKSLFITKHYEKPL